KVYILRFLFSSAFLCDLHLRLGSIDWVSIHTMEQTLPLSGSVDSKDTPDALDSPGMTSGVVDVNPFSIIKESSAEETGTVPGYIRLAKEFLRCIPTTGNITEFDEEQFLGKPEVKKILECEDPQWSLEALGNPQASEKYAELMVLVKKDAEVKSVLAEIKASGPVALLKYWNDKDVLRKLSKPMKSMEGLTTSLVSRDDNEDEQISQGRKALEIVCQHAQLALLDSQKKKANAADKNRGEKRKHHSIGGEKSD
ncbi:unnamed protein product, partial [Arabidopsis halleri]